MSWRRNKRKPKEVKNFDGTKQERRELRREKKKRNNHMNRHHLTNRCMGGTMSIHNILWLDIQRHHAWHELFKNLNLDEVIELLIRVKSAKENQTINHDRR